MKSAMMMGFLTLLSSTLVFAAPKVQTAKLKNFRPGEYLSTSGDQEDCEDMKFDYFPETKNTIILGPHHIMSTVPQKNSIESDLSFQKGCTYDSEDLVEVKGKQTVLTYHEWLRCKGKVRNELIKIATITERNVSLEVQNSNLEDEDASYDFTCSWRHE